jgi:prevent-host-death family protein
MMCSMSHLKGIGVRELRQRASEYLRQVDAGRTVAVTARGRPVALLVPVRETGCRQRLIARRRIVAGAGDLLDLGPPLPPARQVPLPSALLRQARAGER